MHYTTAGITTNDNIWLLHNNKTYNCITSGVVLKIKMGIRCKQCGRDAVGTEVERRMNEDWVGVW